MHAQPAAARFMHHAKIARAEHSAQHRASPGLTKTSILLLTLRQLLVPSLAVWNSAAVPSSDLKFW